MLKIDLSRCKYPNIVAEMETHYMDFEEMGTVLHKTTREAKSMLVSGKKPLYAEDLERVRSFFRIPDMGILAKSELVTSQDGTPFKAVILGMKQEVLHYLHEIKQNGVELVVWQQRNLDNVCNLLIKAEENAINYAEYRFFIDKVADAEKLCKELQGRKEMRALETYIKENPEEAAQKIAEMFSLMDDRDKLMLFGTARRNVKDEIARKERAK